MRRQFLPALAAAALVANAAALFASAPAFACTRVLWSDNKLATIAGRSMDWPESTQPVLTVFPRGMKRDGGKLAGVDVVKDNPLRWTSQYGSLVTTLYGIGTADGLNEKGLGAHLLFLKATDFGERDPAKPGLQAGLWTQYVLDNAATVAEALALLEKIQPVLVETHGHKSTVHLAIEDASGDSAIIEYVGGKPVVHHGRDYKIMTNDPPYDQQLALLKNYDLSKPSKDTPLPEAAPRAEEPARGGRGHVLGRAQRFRALRRALWGVRGLQHGVPHGQRSHRQGLFLRTDDEPQRRLGRSDEIRSQTGRADHVVRPR